MTKLNGSEKQITCAEQIRASLLNGAITQGHCVDDGILQHIAKLEEQITYYLEKSPAKSEKMAEMRIKNIDKMQNSIKLFQELKIKIENETESVWFIDNRNNSRLFTKEVFSKEL